ncbi:retrovirus-related pol polyprotein from transposon TNT 1-94, partial [Tanacetum coccineum]
TLIDTLLIQSDSMGDLYPVLPSSVQHNPATALTTVSTHTWHRRPLLIFSHHFVVAPVVVAPTQAGLTSTHPMTTRSKTGSLKQREIFNLSVVAGPSPIPISTTHALCDLNWRTAIDSKMSSLVSNGTSVLVPPLPSANIIGCHWLYRHKFDSNGNLDCYNDRLLAKGFSQQPGLDYNETFGLIVRQVTIRIVLSDVR